MPMSGPTRRCLSLMKKCRNMKQLKQAHALVIASGLGSDGFALSRLLAFCSDPVRGSLGHARSIFRNIDKPTVCICNTMIKACLLRGELVDTVHIFAHMLRNGVYPDNYTLPYVFKACAKLRDCSLGEIVHGYCLKLCFVSDVFVGNSLISMYSAFGDMGTARYVFDEMPERGAASWTVMISGYGKVGDVGNARLMFDQASVKDVGIWGAMISGYVQNNCFEEGLFMFRLMQMSNVEGDEAIFVSILCACAHLGAMETGIWIHTYLHRINFPLSVRLCTALIDMYAKCGSLKLAKELFDQTTQRDTICWNAMISGMAMHGDGAHALSLFSDMERAKVKPDDITFISVFTACSYSNMAFQGLRMLNRMCSVYNIEPKSEHYGCIVDLLSRSGLLEEAKDIIERLPNTRTSSEEAMAWRTLLSACCNKGESQLAEVAAEKLMQLEHHSGVYVLLSNLYAAAGKHGDAGKMRKMMKSRGVEKAPGCSSIEIDGAVFEFIAGEKMHPHMEEIHQLLEQLHYTG